MDEVAAAIAGGADVVLCPRALRGDLLPPTRGPGVLRLGHPGGGQPGRRRGAQVTAGTGAVVPVSFFERRRAGALQQRGGDRRDGAVLGVYRKSHIPDGPGYEEKFYFRPGDTGFRVWRTRHGRDRRRDLLGPVVPRDARGRWRCRARRCSSTRRPSAASRHQAGNDTPTRGSAAMDGPRRLQPRAPWRRPTGPGPRGRSPSTGPRSSSTTAAGRWPRPAATEACTLTAELDLHQARADRAGWGLFRDRRPDLYGGLASYGG